MNGFDTVTCKYFKANLLRQWVHSTIAEYKIVMGSASIVYVKCQFFFSFICKIVYACTGK